MILALYSQFVNAGFFVHVVTEGPEYYEKPCANDTTSSLTPACKPASRIFVCSPRRQISTNYRKPHFMLLPE